MVVLKLIMRRSGSPQADRAAFMVAVLPPLLPPQLYTKNIRCCNIRSNGAAKLAAKIKRNLSRLRCGCMVSTHPSKVPAAWYAAAQPLKDGSISKSARAVMFREVKTVERGYIARLHWPSRLKAISIFSSPVSMLFKRWVNMIGVLQTVVGIAFFSSMWLMPFSE